MFKGSVYLFRSLVAATSPNPLLDTLLAPNPADLHCMSFSLVFEEPTCIMWYVSNKIIVNLEEMLQLFDGDGKALSLSLPAVSAGVNVMLCLVLTWMVDPLPYYRILA